MDTRDAAQRWVDIWMRSWPTADPEAIEALYAPGAVFASHPFRDPQQPGEYARWAFETQVEAECRFGVPIVDGHQAAVEWWGVITSTDGSVETIAGVSLLRFDARGLVVEQRDAWAGQPGRHELPGWAPRG